MTRKMTLFGLIELGLERDVVDTIKAGHNINTVDDTRNCPLLVAAAYNRLSILKKLILLGANVDVKDCLGRTPLGWAEKHNNHEMKKILEDALKNERVASCVNLHIP